MQAFPQARELAMQEMDAILPALREVEAQGEAEAILAVATATAEGLRRVGEALAGRGGMEAMQLRVAEEYVKQFGKLADEASSTLIVPATLSDISSMIAMATSVVKQQTKVSG